MRYSKDIFLCFKVLLQNLRVPIYKSSVYKLPLYLLLASHSAQKNAVYRAFTYVTPIYALINRVISQRNKHHGIVIQLHLFKRGSV